MAAVRVDRRNEITRLEAFSDAVFAFAPGLSALEAFDARSSMGAHLVSASVGVISMLWAGDAGIPRQFSGFLYFLMTPFHIAYGSWRGKKRRPYEHPYGAAARR